MEVDTVLVKNLLGGVITMLGGASGKGIPSSICILLGFGIIAFPLNKKKK